MIGLNILSKFIMEDDVEGKKVRNRPRMEYMTQIWDNIKKGKDDNTVNIHLGAFFDLNFPVGHTTIMFVIILCSYFYSTINLLISILLFCIIIT